MIGETVPTPDDALQQRPQMSSPLERIAMSDYNRQKVLGFAAIVTALVLLWWVCGRIAQGSEIQWDTTIDRDGWRFSAIRMSEENY